MSCLRSSSAGCFYGVQFTQSWSLPTQRSIGGTSESGIFWHIRAPVCNRGGSRRGGGSDHIPAQMSRRSAVVNYATTIRYGQLTVVVSTCCVGAWIWSDVWSQLLHYVGGLGFPITELCFVYISMCPKFCSIATGKVRWLIYMIEMFPRRKEDSWFYLLP